GMAAEKFMHTHTGSICSGLHCNYTHTHTGSMCSGVHCYDTHTDTHSHTHTHSQTHAHTHTHTHTHYPDSHRSRPYAFHFTSAPGALCLCLWLFNPPPLHRPRNHEGVCVSYVCDSVSLKSPNPLLNFCLTEA